MKRLFYYSTFFLIFFLINSTLFAYPTTEKEPDTGSAPLEILSTQPNRVFIPKFGDFADKYLFSLNDTSKSLTIVDLETWDLHNNQPDDFESYVSDVCLLKDGTTLIVGLSDGNIAELDLDDEDTFENTDTDDSEDDDSTSEEDSDDETTDDSSDDTTDEDEEEDTVEINDSRVTDLASNMTEAGITFMVSDPDENIIYMVNSSGYFFQYIFSSNTLNEMYLENTDTTEETDDDTTTSSYYTPTDMVYAESSSGDKILISTDAGNILVITPGDSTFTIVTLSSSATSFTTVNPNFSDIALTPDNDYLYVVDSDNDLVWVFSLASKSFIDQISSDTGLDPIEVDDSDDNETFANITVYEDDSGDVVAYLSGDSGLTLIDANNPGSTATTKIIDADDSDSTSETPIALTGTPGPLDATTTSSGYVFSINGDASISILTDNPWITISSASATELNETDSTFTLTFQSDVAGSYTIRSNSNHTGASGTELLASLDFEDANTDITTAEIDINDFERSAFIEGENKIFVLVTDDNGLIGHTATLVDVDRPPEATTITGVNFGNKKVYVDFNPSPDEDISYYKVYAEPAESQTSPKCPETLTFDTSDTGSKKLTASNCSDSECNGEVTDLTNDVTYCVAVKVVDEAGQESPLASYSTPVTPEQTVGPAGFLGETSCSLHANKKTKSTQMLLWLFLPLFVFAFYRLKKKTKTNIVFMIFLLSFFFTLSPKANAEELTPQHWTLEPKIYAWLPMDSAVKDFIGMCCHIGGEVEFGYLLKDKYNFTVTTGFSLENGDSVGIRSGATSADSYLLFLIPFRADFVFRFDFKSEQLFVPYLRAGVDVVMFHERSAGNNITNFKYGLHGGAGIGILLDRIEQLGHDLEREKGVNDVYLTIEARYALISSFKSTGLDLSGFYPYIGVLFEF